MYINCLPSCNWLLKSEHKQFAQLAQVSSLFFLLFLFFFKQSFSCVCSHLQVEAVWVKRLCLVHFTFWISHGLVVLLFSLLAEKAISLSYGISWKKNSKFCFSHRPPHPTTLTINPPFCSPPPFLFPFFCLSPFSRWCSPLPVKSAKLSGRELTPQVHSLAI